MRHLLVIALSLAATASASSAEGLAIFPIKLLDTSQEVQDQTADHERRQTIVARILAAEIEGAALVKAESVAESCSPETTECLMGLARDTGAERALLLVFVKTSTLIVQVFANLVDTETGELIDSHSLNFRGDNDEAWARASRFMAAQFRSK